MNIKKILTNKLAILYLLLSVIFPNSSVLFAGEESVLVQTNRFYYGGVVVKIIPPTLLCPFFTYYIKGPASAIITPIKIGIPIKYGDTVAGRLKMQKIIFCTGSGVQDIGVAGKVYQKDQDK